MHQYQYRLLQPSDDYKEATIEKAGITAEFTIAEVEAIQNRNRKAEREVEGQLTIERAKVENILRNHPSVGELDGLTLTAAALYKESLSVIAECEAKLPSIKAAIEENDTMLADVKEQFNFKTDVTNSENKEG